MVRKIVEPIHLRVEPEFKKQIEAVAEAHNRTVNGLLVTLLNPIINREFRKIKNGL